MDHYRVKKCKKFIQHRYCFYHFLFLHITRRINSFYISPFYFLTTSKLRKKKLPLDNDEWCIGEAVVWLIYWVRGGSWKGCKHGMLGNWPTFWGSLQPRHPFLLVLLQFSIAFIVPLVSLHFLIPTWNILCDTLCTFKARYSSILSIIQMDIIKKCNYSPSTFLIFFFLIILHLFFSFRRICKYVKCSNLIFNKFC